jgi:hypothetical protein
MRRARFITGFVVFAGLASLTPLLSPAFAGAGERADLPPATRKELAAIFDEQVEPFGLRVTRAALVNARQERDRSGDHLAIYVEPTGKYTPQEYIDGVVDVTRVFLPSVFNRWKDLESFDVCQEPLPSVDDSKTPSPKTQVFATRAGNKLVDWSTVDVARLVALANAEDVSVGTRQVRFSLFVARHLQNTPAYQQAVPATGDSTATTPTVSGYG